MTRGIVGLAVLSASIFASADAYAIRIEVDERQAVSISGTSDSLRETVIEVCARAGVELRAFDAPDRAVAAQYEAIPLSEALARLLRSEAFIAGMRPEPHGESARVAWLHVSGSAGGVASTARLGPADLARPPATPVASGFDFGPNPRLVETALTSKDPVARGRARQAIFESLLDDPSALQRFAQRDVDQTVEELAGFPHAAEFLRAVQTVTIDPGERRQIQSIIAKVQVRQAGD